MSKKKQQLKSKISLGRKKKKLALLIVFSESIMVSASDSLCNNRCRQELKSGGIIETKRKFKHKILELMLPSGGRPSSS